MMRWERNVEDKEIGVHGLDLNSDGDTELTIAEVKPWVGLQLVLLSLMVANESSH